MSYTETHVGKIKKIDLKGLSIEEWAEETCNSLKMALTDYNSYTELIFDKLYHTYILVKKELYEIIEDREFNEEYISELIPEGDDVFSFVLQFYNGGTCLVEMLEDAIKKYNK